MITVKFISGTTEIIAEANVGDTILQVAKAAGVRLVGGCGGVGVCGTCHVLIDSDFIAKVNEKSFEENDILEILPSRKENSRLACQVVLSENMDGITVTIP
jgi:ferredoxin